MMFGRSSSTGGSCVYGCRNPVVNLGVTDQGSFFRGQYPAVSGKGWIFDMYTLEFLTRITSGGTGWRVAGGANEGYAAYFVLTSSTPGLDSPATSPLPTNYLTIAFGFSIIQQQILPSSPTQV